MMRFMRNWIDIISDNPLFEMAYQRRKLIDLLIAQQGQITQHLIKVAMFPDSRDQQHWKSEILGFIGTFSALRVKPRGAKLKQSDYYEYLFFGPVHDVRSITSLMYSISKRYQDEKPSNMGSQQLYEKIADFYDDLSAMVADSRENEIVDLVFNFPA